LFAFVPLILWKGLQKRNHDLLFVNFPCVNANLHRGNGSYVMIIITGGAGLIGSALVWQLNQEQEDNILVVDRLGDAEKWRNLAPLRYRDFADKQEFMFTLHEDGRLPEGTTAVLHMGACSSTTERDAGYLMDNNARYTLELARLCRDADVPFIYASSAATYGDGAQGYKDGVEDLNRLRPLSMYGYSKHLADLWMNREGLLESAIGFKFFNVFGVNEYHKDAMRSMSLKAWEQIKEKGRVKLFSNHRDEHSDGDEIRDFIYIKDVARCVIHALKEKCPGGLYNMGSGIPRSFHHVVEAVFGALGRKPEIDWIAMPRELRDQYQYYTCADMKASEEAGFMLPSMSLEEAMHDYVVEYLERGCVHLGQ
jgi:ADP-L-glycero-D-manno-heptose 6-epimerase